MTGTAPAWPGISQLRRIAKCVLVSVAAVGLIGAPAEGAVGCGAAEPPPVATAEYPHQLPSFFAGDPFVLVDHQTSTYYLYNTGGSPLTARRSKDLVNWSDPFPVFTVPADSWAVPDFGAWAPEVHRYQGRYYLFSTLHNPTQVIREPQEPTAASGICGECTQNRQIWRSTVVAVSDSPAGPFELVDRNTTLTPRDFMSLDGTLYVEDGQPWMVYAHEWVQIIDGTIERVPLTADLAAAAGQPVHMFRGSDAAWYNEPGVTVPTAERQLPPYVTDGPEFVKTRDGALIMLWTTYADFRRNYTQTYAISPSGKLSGPWRQGGVLLDEGRGHGMIFRSLDGEPLLILHNNARGRRAEIYEIEANRRGVSIGRNRTDLWDPLNTTGIGGQDAVTCRG